MNEPLAFGHYVKQRRRDQDLTQAMLARCVGCAEITIQKIEAGRLRPSRQIAERLAEALALTGEERIGFIQLARRPPPALSEMAVSHARRLPIPPTPLIGREREMAAVSAALLRNDVRLLTLIGPPGVGKTHLALSVAAQLGEHFADGIIFVNLAPINQPGQVIPAIARALNLPERMDQKLDEQLSAVLHGRNLLLLLDNFEHLVTAAPYLAQLLATASVFKVFATSRVVLHLSGEHVYGLAPLPLPPLANDAQTSTSLIDQPAVALFLMRARALKPNFVLAAVHVQAIAAICVRLDGLPLAIELAAARIKLFSPQMLFKRLEQRLALLTGGAQDLPARQQTLRGAIDWSYQLLNRREQVLFARLAVFVGGCTIEAVEEICCPEDPDILDLLTRLFDKSLVQQVDDGEGRPRFMVLDTIREYALERLSECGELAQLRCRHAVYFMTLAEQAEPAFEGAERAHQQAWLHYFDREHDNVRAALHWCFTTPEGSHYGIRLTAAIWQFWWIRGYLTEGRRWVAQALTHISAATRLRAKLLNQAGFLAFSQADYTAARNWHEESLALASSLADQQALADALIGLANIASRRSDYHRADQLFRQSAELYQELGDRGSYAWSLAGMANMARIAADYTQTRTLLEKSRSLFQLLGDQRGLAYVINDLGLLAYDERDFATAHTLFTESLALFTALAERHAISGVLTCLGHTALRQADVSHAIIRYRESLAVCRELADRAGIADNLMGMASAVAAQGDVLQAAQWWGAAETLREAISDSLLPIEQANYAGEVAAARAQCKSADFEVAWQTGCALSCDEVVAQAIAGQC